MFLWHPNNSSRDANSSLISGSIYWSVLMGPARLMVLYYQSQLQAFVLACAAEGAVSPLSKLLDVRSHHEDVRTILDVLL
jgi:hypothetical protein